MFEAGFDFASNAPNLESLRCMVLINCLRCGVLISDITQNIVFVVKIRPKNTLTGPQLDQLLAYWTSDGT